MRQRARKRLFSGAASVRQIRFAQLEYLARDRAAVYVITDADSLHRSTVGNIMHFQGDKEGLIQILKHISANATVQVKNDAYISKTTLRDKLASVQSLIDLVIASIESGDLG